nr:hypothetical protein [Bradyrhizobium centrolobii]
MAKPAEDPFLDLSSPLDFDGINNFPVPGISVTLGANLSDTLT